MAEQQKYQLPFEYKKELLDQMPPESVAHLLKGRDLFLGGDIGAASDVWFDLETTHFIHNFYVPLSSFWLHESFPNESPACFYEADVISLAKKFDKTGLALKECIRWFESLDGTEEFLLEAYSSLIEIDPYHAEYFLGQASTYFKRDQFKKALASVKKAIYYKHNYLAAILLRARTYVKLKDYNNALHDYTKSKMDHLPPPNTMALHSDLKL